MEAYLVARRRNVVGDITAYFGPYYSVEAMEKEMEEVHTLDRYAFSINEYRVYRFVGFLQMETKYELKLKEE
jgi:hypothetical protein